MRRAPWVALVLLSLTGVARAQLLGPEFQVNSVTANYQAAAAIAPTGATGFVVTWNSYGQDGSSRGVFAQRFDALGAPEGPELPVNTFTTGAQGLPAVAGDGTGEFVVAWTSYVQDGSAAGVFARRYDATGGPLSGEFLVNTFTADDQKGVSVAVDPVGNFAAAWWSVAQDGSAEGVYTQRYDANGVTIGGETRVNAFTTGQQWRPSVAAAAAGTFVVAWSSDEQDGDAHGVFARSFDALGAPVGGEIPVNQFTTGEQTAPAVATDAEGNFVVVWSSAGQDGSNEGIWARHFTAAGAPTGNERRINVTTLGPQSDPAIAGDGDGGFVVTWQDETLADVFARRLDATGAPAGREFRVNTFTTSSQRRPSVAALSTGEFTVVWESSFQLGASEDVFGQRVVGGLFHDGFETADVCAWSASAGGGACP